MSFIRDLGNVRAVLTFNKGSLLRLQETRIFISSILEPLNDRDREELGWIEILD
jgi:hypothetical protein